MQFYGAKKIECWMNLKAHESWVFKTLMTGLSHRCLLTLKTRIWIFKTHNSGFSKAPRFGNPDKITKKLHRTLWKTQKWQKCSVDQQQGDLWLKQTDLTQSDADTTNACPMQLLHLVMYDIIAWRNMSICCWYCWYYNHRVVFNAVSVVDEWGLFSGHCLHQEDSAIASVHSCVCSFVCVSSG